MLYLNNKRLYIILDAKIMEGKDLKRKNNNGEMNRQHKFISYQFQSN